MDNEFSSHDAEADDGQDFEEVSYEVESDDFASSEAEDAQAADREFASSLAASELQDSVLVLEEVDIALVLPVWEPTGDAQVDAALEELATLDELAVHDHAEVLTSVHSGLHQRLTDISA